MRRAVLILVIAIFAAGSTVWAQNFPDQQSNQPQRVTGNTAAQQKMFYGYIPPAPIRHTWPGGYRVIFHELGNTLMEHILGHY
ncbi:hypothetical protein [Desulfomonile tiedjei]|uniref:Uncharacterized protein n=1 Tax=Desulfomonile tiedjei (strain ATCC 49306 / DSM 6799 / DCB-1) TaxID=706587 RepID=I4C490_DESTA|nr:hypothetical protein [Desulfomonile tiedjei]AFM24381.1 hypothetical protein Desti_1670 [Desulfomonile tiedjei DSM 6799]